MPSREEGGRAQVDKLVMICPAVIDPGQPQALLQVLCVRVLFKRENQGVCENPPAEVHC